MQKDVSPTRQCSALTAMFIRERGELSTLRATMSSKPRYAVGLKRSDVCASGRDEKKCLERSHMTVSEANGTPHPKNTPCFFQFCISSRSLAQPAGTVVDRCPHSPVLARHLFYVAAQFRSFLENLCS